MTSETTIEYRPDFVDRATLPLGRCEALTDLIEEFIESVANTRDQACRGDAMVHALQLELAELRAVIETADDGPSRKSLSAVCTRHGVSPAAMTAAVAEILTAGADRPDSWEGETARQLLTVAKPLE